MIKNDFKINFEKKTILHTGKSKKVYSAKELYSFLMDLFDELENMKHDVPIAAKSKDQFEFVNGWALDEKSQKYIKGTIT